MNDMVVMDNLSFKYGNCIIFNNLSLSIKKGVFTTILGNNGSGKSTLIRLITGLEKTSSSIFIDGIVLNDSNLGSVRSKIGVVFDNPDNFLISETVMSNLAFPLENMNYSCEYIFSRIYEISNYLNISHLLNCSPLELSGGERQLVSLGCALITGPKLLILDDAFSMLDGISRINMLMLLKRINCDFGTTIINFTHDVEESLYGDDILVIDDGKVVIHDSKENVYKQEKLLRNMGFDLPFMVDLSSKLSYYDLVDNNVYDINEMVDLLWK